MKSPKLPGINSSQTQTNFPSLPGAGGGPGGPGKPNVSEITKFLAQMLKFGTKGKNGKMRPLTFSEKNRVEGLIKFLNDPNAKAGAISKVIASIGTAGGALALNIGESLASTVLPREETKRRQIDAYKEVALAQNKSSQAIQEQAIAAGIWNQGLMGNPDNSSGQQPGSDGKKGNQTPGSYFGG